MKKHIYTDVKRINPNEYIFIAIINDNGLEEILQKRIQERTDNRAIIMGLAKTLKNIHEKEKLGIYTKTNFGFKSLKTIKGWCNGDVGSILANIIEEKQLTVEFYNYNNPQRPDLNWIKNKMKECMKKIIIDKEKLPHGGRLIIRTDNQTKLKNPIVNIYVRGECKTNESHRPGRYAVLIRGAYRQKTLYGAAEHTTSNRMIITGLIEALKLINVPYNIRLYTHAKIGLKKAYKKNTGPNIDLLKKAIKLLEEGEHDLEEYVGNEMQEELRYMISSWV